MRFITVTLIVHAPDPRSGAQKSTQSRFQEVLDSALLAEELGFDGFGVGERHERPSQRLPGRHHRLTRSGEHA
jgi:alkanesulfonate monooxygenase SsuD/methylene tetrahydromethanopterin reductase-like flavin-dependent oxidoreductase (luciferase family)